MPPISASGIRSDVLNDLRPLFETVPILKMFEGIAQLSLIIDANILMGDLLWMTKKRETPGARTELFELLQAGTVRAFAPTFLAEEMAINLPREAKRKKVSLETLNGVWIEYKELISFVDVGGPDEDYHDPKDAPYIKLQRQVGALIYSRDQDIPKMKGSVVSAVVIASLRIYSRQVVVEYSIKAGGTGCLYISFELLKLMTKFVRALFGGAKRMPKKIWLIAMAILLGVLIYPPSRKYLVNSINSLGERVKSIGSEMLEQFIHLANEHEAAKAQASSALTVAQSEIALYPDTLGIQQRKKADEFPKSQLNRSQKS